MPLAPPTVDTRFRYVPLFANHSDTESTEETIFLPDRETGRSGKRSQPCGHDLVTEWPHVIGWIQAKELPPQAVALFPGRSACGGAREKTTSSVYSVPLW
jgi:hypothetical protein